MPYQRLIAAKEKSVGSKQTLKALKNNLAKVVYIAQDAEKHVSEPIINMCQEKAIPAVRVDSMKSLGKACGIKVDCAAAAILKDK